MTPPKLSESDKQEVVRLYRLPEETTATIANRYEVSTTTVSRILRSYLPEEEYEVLMQQKRQIRVQQTVVGDQGLEDGQDLEDDSLIEGVEIDMSSSDTSEVEDFSSTESALSNQRRSKRRSSSLAKQNLADFEDEPPEEPFFGADVPHSSVDDFLVPKASTYAQSPFEEEVSVAEDVFDDEDFFATNDDPDLIDLDEEGEGELEEELDDEDLDGEDELDLEDDLDGEDDDEIKFHSLPVLRAMQVLPLSEATLPKIFYLVVDRMSELITRPLKDFSELGQIPEGEVQARTLPIFDNHRVARRFSRKNQKIVKITDSNLLLKVSNQLRSKGITRLLINGRIYTLNGA